MLLTVSTLGAAHREATPRALRGLPPRLVAANTEGRGVQQAGANHHGLAAHHQLPGLDVSEHQIKIINYYGPLVH